MEFIIKLMTVAGFGFVELWVAIPVGTALNLPPWLNGLASASGSITAAVTVVFFGGRLRDWLLKNRQTKEAKRGKIYEIWDRYGVIGLGILSPLLTGALLGAAIGVSLGAAYRRLIIWMVIGIIFWTIPLTAVSTLGFGFFRV